MKDPLRPRRNYFNHVERGFNVATDILLAAIKVIFGGPLYVLSQLTSKKDNDNEGCYIRIASECPGTIV